MNYRITANKRSQYALEEYDRLIKSYTDQDKISGFKARKIDQAYRIYKHYLFVFNGSIIKPSAIYNKAEIDLEKRKRRERKENAIKDQTKRQIDNKV